MKSVKSEKKITVQDCLIDAKSNHANNAEMYEHKTIKIIMHKGEQIDEDKIALKKEDNELNKNAKKVMLNETDAIKTKAFGGRQKRDKGEREVQD